MKKTLKNNIRPKLAILLVAILVATSVSSLIAYRHFNAKQYSNNGFVGQCNGAVKGEIDVAGSSSLNKDKMQQLVRESGISANIKYVGRNVYAKDSGNPTEELYILKVASGQETPMADFLNKQAAIFSADAFGQPCPI